MAFIHNSELSKELVKGASLQQTRDIIPNQLAEKVVPVMEVNPRLLKYSNVAASASANNATTTTIYTVPTDRDFYLCGCNLSVIKDVTSTSTFSAINITVDETAGTVAIASIAGITLTVQNSVVSNNFSYPIKLKAASNITVTNTTNVANILAKGSIWGYTVDVARG